MADDVKESSGAAGVAGFQLPLGSGKKKKKVDENSDCGVEGPDVEMEMALRELVRGRLREIVRKKPGGGGWLLYAPNPGKKKNPKPVGEFPTKLGAKSAELQRFPPKDPDKLKKTRNSIDKLRKNPKKAAEKEREAEKKASDGKKKKNENVERVVREAIMESLFREAPDSSAWEELMTRLSKQALMSDKKLQQFEKLIGKQSEQALRDGIKALTVSLKKSKFVVQSGGEVKKDSTGKIFVPFSINDKEGASAVGPIFLFIEDGRLKIEVSESARSAMTQLDGERSKILKGELVGMQEDLLDRMDSVVKVVKKRDDYLNKMQDELDSYVSDLSALEISMLKNLLVQKYRKI